MVKRLSEILHNIKSGTRYTKVGTHTWASQYGFGPIMYTSLVRDVVSKTSKISNSASTRKFVLTFSFPVFSAFIFLFSCYFFAKSAISYPEFTSIKKIPIPVISHNNFKEAADET